MCPKSNCFLELNFIKPLAEAYGADLDDLTHEVHQAKRLIERKARDGAAKPILLIEFLRFLEPYKDAFYELYRLCKIAVTIPATSVSSERSFSALKIIKTYLRNSMLHERSSNLGVISVERKRSGSLDLEEFVDIFSTAHNNRKILLF